MIDDLLNFAEEKEAMPIKNYWNVLIVDDDKEVHEVTKLALKYFVLDGKSINFISVYSCAEAKEYLSAIEDNSIAVILLDVIMETNTAGFEVADYVRTNLENNLTRIILRTGQAAHIPEEEVVLKYDINDYKAKTELTSSRLFISMVTSFRAYDELIIRHKHEVELEKSQKELIAANHAKSRFLSRMSHELLTPLNAIIGFSQLQELADNSFNECDKGEYTGHVLKAAHHLKMLVDDMLALIDMQSANLVIAKAPCQISEILDDCIAIISIPAAEKNITISMVDTDIVVSADYARLTQCLLNLLTNAIKFNRPNGNIIITVEDMADRKVALTVADSGVGIAENEQAYIFENFTRLDYADKYEIQGVGVGLPLVKQLIKQMGGEVKVESTLGEGSLFSMILSKAELE